MSPERGYRPVIRVSLSVLLVLLLSAPSFAAYPAKSELPFPPVEQASDASRYFITEETEGLPAGKRPISSRRISKADVISTNNMIEVEIGESVSLVDFNNLTRAFSLSPDTVGISVISGDEALVTGIKPGSGIVNMWEGEKAFSVRVNVRYKGFAQAEEIIKRAAEGPAGRPIKFSYSYDLFKSRSWSKFSPYAWKQQDQIHTYKLSGDMPYGYLDATYGYIYRKNQSGLANDIQIATTSLENRFFKIAAGDMFADFSEITLPSLTHYQGFRFKSGSSLKNFKYDFVMGTSGYYQWGHKISSYGQLKNKFMGGRVEIQPQKDISVWTTYLVSPQDTDNASRELGSIGASYNIGSYLNFSAEGAINDDHRYAFLSSVNLNIDKFSATSTFRNIDVDYLNLTGNTAYRGRRGVYNKFSFKPYRNLSFGANLDVYQNRLNPDPDNVDRTNFDSSISSRFYYERTKTTLSASFYNRDDRGQEFGSVSSGQAYGIDQNIGDFYLIGDTRAFVRFEPTTYKSYITGESTYGEKLFRMGLNTRARSGVSFFLQETFDYRRWPVRDYSTAPSRFEGRIMYSPRFGKAPMSMNVYFGGQLDSHVNQDKISAILGEDKLLGGTEVTCNLSPYASAFFNANVEKTWGSEDYTLDRLQFDISCGVRGEWDTNVSLPAHGTIKGVVFKDSNKDKKFGIGDAPIPGARVYTSKKRFAVTDKNGMYRIKWVRPGSEDIFVDPSSLPSGFGMTTPIKTTVTIAGLDVVEVDFGAAPRASIEGEVFNDLDRKGVRDEADEALANILIRLDDGKAAFTNAYGYFVIPDVTVGERTLVVDKSTIPQDLIAEGPLELKIKTEEGKTAKVTFAFYALRAVAGKVYLDANSNRRLDADETLEGVRLSALGASAVTDKKGEYILRNLPAGKGNITVETGTLPAGCEVAGDQNMELELKKGPDIREGFDIRIIRRP